MRKCAWLTAFAAAAFFFGAAENAFAHPNHHHVQYAPQSAPALTAENAALTIMQTERFDEVVSVAQPQSEKCPHGQGADCKSCCACAGSASVALVMPDFESGGPRARSEMSALALPYRAPQTVFDLSRPPKYFA